ncbi:FAD-dependent oxidoreductase [Frigoribacterium sp. VKM Ac-2530]|uniref:FAD-dependent oxidoreductase n=1 Tax=Frigoribacterium sp. VKM Ac-2530 TaxID=2783822 RepID=UPI00188CFC9F|nr:FAD-dependent oxidoreductase [Frigoribacterium sp. VKM Ac-2530]MBF4579434.1 FAD-dependent oxidoreductase [Frigoribacterium sp. VKM Ac-2530]
MSTPEPEPAAAAAAPTPAAAAPASTTERWDHVVVGAGVIGAATARALARRGGDGGSGASVLLVEQFGRGHDRGSSHGASRIFRRGYTADDWLALTGDAITAWQALEAETGRTLLDFTGALDHGDPAVLDEIQAALERGGVAHERLAPDEAATRWPGLRFDTSVLVHAQAGRVRSADAVEALLDSAAAAGAELRFDTVVAAIETAEIETEGGDVVLRLGGAGGASSTVVSTSVVLAVGSWARHLAGDLVRRGGAALPEVRVTQEEPAHFATELPDNAWPSFVHHPTDPALRARVSTIYGLLTPGEGVKVGTHGTGREVHPDARLVSPGAEGQAVLRDYVAAWVPGVDVDTLAPISCLYDTTPTEDPVLDRVGSVTVATGFSGHGFKFGAVFGELLAGVATGTPAPERFRLRRG